MGNYGPGRKTTLCNNAIIRDERNCSECDSLKDKVKKCIGSECGKDFTPTCTRKFICYACQVFNKGHDDVIYYSADKK